MKEIIYINDYINDPTSTTDKPQIFDGTITSFFKITAGNNSENYFPFFNIVSQKNQSIELPSFMKMENMQASIDSSKLNELFVEIESGTADSSILDDKKEYSIPITLSTNSLSYLFNFNATDMPSDLGSFFAHIKNDNDNKNKDIVFTYDESNKEAPVYIYTKKDDEVDNIKWLCDNLKYFNIKTFKEFFKWTDTKNSTSTYYNGIHDQCHLINKQCLYTEYKAKIIINELIKSMKSSGELSYIPDDYKDLSLYNILLFILEQIRDQKKIDSNGFNLLNTILQTTTSIFNNEVPSLKKQIEFNFNSNGLNALKNLLKRDSSTPSDGTTVNNFTQLDLILRNSANDPSFLKINNLKYKYSPATNLPPVDYFKYQVYKDSSIKEYRQWRIRNSLLGVQFFNKENKEDYLNAQEIKEIKFYLKSTTGKLFEFKNNTAAMVFNFESKNSNDITYADYNHMVVSDTAYTSNVSDEQIKEYGTFMVKYPCSFNTVYIDPNKKYFMEIEFSGNFAFELLEYVYDPSDLYTNNKTFPFIIDNYKLIIEIIF